MYDMKKTEIMMSIILTVGMIISIILILSGGILYLLQYGNDIMRYDSLQLDAYKTSIIEIWKSAFTLSPYALIELGIFILVITQAVRVALLAWYYAAIKDTIFSLISVFIISVLIYSLFFRY